MIELIDDRPYNAFYISCTLYQHVLPLTEFTRLLVF